MLYCKKVFHTIQNVRFKGKVSYNLSWKFWDILYIWRFLLPPTSFGDSLSELLGLCFPPWVSCSSTTREYTKFLCHWLWLIMANWHQMPCSQNWQQNINALHDLCFHVCHWPWIGSERQWKVNSAQSNVLENWVTFLILRSSSWQTLSKGFVLSFHVWRGKYRRESQHGTGSNSGLKPQEC